MATKKSITGTQWDDLIATSGSTSNGKAAPTMNLDPLNANIVTAGSGNDTVLSGAGNDSIDGGNGNDLVHGGDGADTIIGGNGVDTLYGDGGNDVMWGDSLNNTDTSANGADFMYGGDGNDQVHGGNGDDWVEGDDGNDQLFGDNGNDHLYGGAGGDVLTGGLGNDTFMFPAQGDSPYSGTGNWNGAVDDWVKDFQPGVDKLDFTGLHLHFTGTTPGAYGVWNTTDGAGNKVVEADTNGDGVADMIIKVNAWPGAGDFVGLNHAPTAVADTGDATEAGVNPGSDATGNVLTNDSDPDSDPIHVSGISNVHSGTGTVGSALAGNYGSLTLNADGSYDYVVDNSNSTVNALNGTQTLTDTFTYQVSDPYGGVSSTTITITIHGQNDNPIAVADTGDATEDGVNPGSDATGNVLTNDSDPDNGDTIHVSAVSNVHTGDGTVGSALVGDYGSLTLNADGSYDYVIDNTNSDVNALNGTQTLTDTFTYQVADGNGGFATTTLTITIHGANDNPIAVADTGDATEDGVSPGSDATGNVLTNDTDPDNGDVIHVSAVSNLHSGDGTVGSGLTGDYGTLTLNADGSYDYVVDNSNSDVNALNGTQTLTDTFTYQVADGNGGFDTTTLTITIHGANDAPTAVADTGDATEDGVNPGSDATGNVLTNDTDPDNGDTLQVSAVSNVHSGTGTVGDALAGDYGSLTLGSDGSYTYVVDNSNSDVNALNAGDTLTDTFTYQVSDGNGGLDTTTLTITIHGQNDAPVTVDDTASVGEKGPPVVIDALANDHDPDSGDTMSITQVDGHDISVGNPVTLGDGSIVSLNADGTLSYDPNGAWNSLNTGDTGHEIFSYTVSDSHGATSTGSVDVSVNGVTDVPPDPLSDPNDFDNGAGLPPSDPNGGSNTYNGTNSGDTIVASSNDDVIHAGSGSDLIYTEAGSDNIDGDPGNSPGGGSDTVYAGSGDDTVAGGSNNDLIYGGSGNDSIDGGSGNDTIIGGYGQDIMHGGTGADTFQFLYAHDSLQAAPDLIQDFVDTAQNGTTHDLIDLSAIDGATSANVSWSYDSVNNVTKIIVHAANGTMEIDLTGDYTASGGHALSASDFHFHS